MRGPVFCALVTHPLDSDLTALLDVSTHVAIAMASHQLQDSRDPPGHRQGPSALIKLGHQHPDAMYGTQMCPMPWPGHRLSCEPARALQMANTSATACWSASLQAGWWCSSAAIVICAEAGEGGDVKTTRDWEALWPACLVLAAAKQMNACNATSLAVRDKGSADMQR